jgi:hypothetical protein
MLVATGKNSEREDHILTVVAGLVVDPFDEEVHIPEQFQWILLVAGTNPELVDHIPTPVAVAGSFDEDEEVHTPVVAGTNTPKLGAGLTHQTPSPDPSQQSKDHTPPPIPDTHSHSHSVRSAQIVHIVAAVLHNHSLHSDSDSHSYSHSHSPQPSQLYPTTFPRKMTTFSLSSHLLLTRPQFPSLDHSINYSINQSIKLNQTIPYPLKKKRDEMGLRR